MGQKQSRHIGTPIGFVLASVLLGLLPVVAVTGCSSEGQQEVKPMPDKLRQMQIRGQAAKKVGKTRPATGAPSRR